MKKLTKKPARSIEDRIKPLSEVDRNITNREESLVRLGVMRVKDTQRFISHFKRPLATCWEWQSSRRPDGYGEFRLYRTTLRAHRVSWRLFNGPIPRGLCVLHHCDNRKCVRPSHLFLGTRPDNMADKIRKGRDLRGEAHPLAKLTEADVLAIRASTGTHKETAAQYGVSPSRISYIRTRKHWTLI